MDKPFIHLLRSPNSGYFYDVNRNEIVAVDRFVYNLLSSVLNGQTKFETALDKSDIVRKLHSQGYLTSALIKELEHTSTKDLSYLLERKIPKMTLQITQDCNFRCKYCVYSQNNNMQRHHSKKYMTLETAQKAVDFLHNHSIDCDTVNIGLYGGEPLMAFPLMKDIISYAERVFLGKQLTFSMTTNATLLTDDVLEYLSVHKCQITISMDGIREVHNANRVFKDSGLGTYDVVIKNIRNIRKNFPVLDSQLSISMVIDPQNSFDNTNAIFEQDLFKPSQVTSTVIDDLTLDNKLEFSESYITQSSYQRFLGELSLINRFPIEKLSPIIYRRMIDVYKQIASFKPGSLPAVPNGPCIPGGLRLFISVDGNFYPCERVSETSECMIIGNLYDGFDIKRVSQLLNISQISAEECLHCFAFRYCGLCVKYAHKDGVLSKDHHVFCDDRRKDMEYFLREVIAYKEFVR